MNTRREFLFSASVAAAGLVLAPLANAASPLGLLGNEPKPGTAPLLTRAIPSTGEQLPVIGAGTSGSYEVELGSADFQTLKDTIRVFFESGGRVFDTAPNYSNAEQVLGALLEEGGW